jgi:hypothetical protein
MSIRITFQLFFITFLLICTSIANALEPTPFKAQYALYKGGLHLANSEIILDRSNNFWRWSMTSKARSVYQLFSDSQPYTETILSLKPIGAKLYNILITDLKDREKFESVRFDWTTKTADIQRKSKHKIEFFSDPVYDYNSIHFLIAKMHSEGLVKTNFTFYRKGKLIQSNLEFKGKSIVEINEKSINANRYQQTLQSSKSTITYDYGIDNPLLPIRIERLHPSKKSSIMILQSVTAG